MIKYSIVIAVYNSEGSLELLYNKIKDSLQIIGGESEIIFVDDCSNDGSVEILQKLSFLDDRIKIFSFSFNSGHALALKKGFDEARGEIIISIDDDLQQDPAEIPKLIAKLNEGFDVVCGWRMSRRDPVHRVVMSKIGNYIMRKIAGIQLHDIGCTMRAYRKYTVKDLVLNRNDISFIPYILLKNNYKIAEVKIKHYTRINGSSNYNFLSIIFMEIRSFIRYFISQR